MTRDFLTRWSRRKQAAAQQHAANPRAPESSAASGVAQNAPPAGAPAFDPASLPAIEEITAETDIRAFFAASVPAELTRAALRRVWASDPKIRDFVGLADYDWDFNAPGSMAGFGPLEGADELRAQAAHWVGPGAAQDSTAEIPDPDPGAKQDAPGAGAAVHNRPGQPAQIAADDEPSRKLDQSQNRDESTHPEGEPASRPRRQENPEDVQSIARRKHGGALPKS